MKTKVIGYWATTAMLAFAMLSGGAAELAHRRENVEGMVSTCCARARRGARSHWACPTRS